MLNQTIVTINSEDTKNLAAKLSVSFTAGNIICLWGELAAGKTTFVQGLANSYGISRLTSPTYVLLSQYKVEKHPTIKTLYHFDLYRLERIEDLRSVNFEEIISDQNGLVLIEWPERLGDNIPKERIDIHLKFINDSQREISIRKLK